MGNLILQGSFLGGKKGGRTFQGSHLGFGAEQGLEFGIPASSPELFPPNSKGFQDYILLPQWSGWTLG